MKIDQNILKQMHDATRTLLAGGPHAATAAIQRALNGAQTMQVPKHDARVAPSGKAASGTQTMAGPMADSMADSMAGFVPDLLAKLRILMPAEGMSFDAPSFTPPPGDMSEAAAKTVTATGGRFISGSFTNQAGTRQYKLYIPSCYKDKPLPLVVMLHGCTQNPDDFANGTQMNALAEEHQCLVVYPAQTQGANSSKCWNWFNALDQKRDQGEPSIIAGITRKIGEEYQVDSSRVYIAGLSAGGAMAAIMHATYPDIYAAAGVHSGLAFGAAHDLSSALGAMRGGGAAGMPKLAAHAKVIPIIVFHGDRDKTVHPRNGDNIMSQSLSRLHGSSGIPDVIVQEGQSKHGQSYTCTMHRNSGGQVIAEQWLLHGAGHAWSGGSKSGTYTDPAGPDAAQEMMRFFYSHSLPD